MTGLTTNGRTATPNRSDQLTSLQNDIDIALSILDKNPTRLQAEDLRSLLNRVRGFLSPKHRDTRLLLTLPEELTDRIVFFCDRATLKALRLVCRPLSRIATPKLFGSVHIALFKDILKNFLKIATHPDLSKHVKRLVFHGQIPRSFRSQKDWEKSIDLRPYPTKGPPMVPGMFHDGNPFPPGTTAYKAWKDTPRHTKSQPELTEHYKNYTAFNHTVSDVMRWLHAKNYGRRPDLAANRCNPMRPICEEFPQAVANLSNLETAVLTCHDFDDDEHPFWKAMQKKILMTPSQWKRYYPPGESPICYDQFDYHMEGVIQLSMLLQALGKANGTTKLRSLSIAAERDPFWVQEHLWDPADVWDAGFADSLALNTSYISLFDTMATSFSTITHLNMDIQYQLGGNHSLIADRLSDFLHKAGNLERLNLDFMEGNWDGREEGQERCDLLARLQDIEWPRLKSLRLEVITTSHAFLGFLRRVAPTLKALDLYHVSLVHGTGIWEDVIAQLPQILHLEAVTLDSLWDANTDFPVEKNFGDTDSVISEEFGRYLLEDAAWDQDLDCHARALHDFITRKSSIMPPLDEDAFFDIHECPNCPDFEFEDRVSSLWSDDEKGMLSRWVG